MSYANTQTLNGTMVNISHTVDHCRVLGPGRRFVLWVQGCPLNCPGCINPQFIPFRDASWVAATELAAAIQRVEGIEGVTFVGGEPFAQAAALSQLAMVVRRTGLSVMTYTGYTFKHLQSGRVPDASALLAASDLLMDGPYRADQPTRRPWRGSDNQCLIALSGRYRAQLDDWNQPVGQDFELTLRQDGSLEILGIPPLELIQRQPSALPAATTENHS